MSYSAFVQSTAGSAGLPFVSRCAPAAVASDPEVLVGCVVHQHLIPAPGLTLSHWALTQVLASPRRSPVYGIRGMVASAQPLATEAGLRVLQQGGNAADAAVAVAAALCVTEPCSTGAGLP
jgi:hypothetical protein